ncbi:DCL protein [Hirschfeldia incana]|nr:DCL protein [Hirschfeldia incana]
MNLIDRPQQLGDRSIPQSTEVLKNGGKASQEKDFLQLCSKLSPHSSSSSSSAQNVAVFSLGDSSKRRGGPSMTSLLLLRTLPLLRNGFLNHNPQFSIASASFLSHRRRLLSCSLADKPQFREDDSPAMKSTKAPVVVDESWRYEDPDYRKWKNLEAEILGDIEPIALLAKDILHSDRYLDGERLDFEDEKIIMERLLAFHPYAKDKIGCGLDFIMVDRHPQFRHSRCLFVVRTDGGWIDFSYQKCLRAYVRLRYPSHAERFIREHFKRASS